MLRKALHSQNAEIVEFNYLLEIIQDPSEGQEKLLAMAKTVQIKTLLLSLKILKPK